MFERRIGMGQVQESQSASEKTALSLEGEKHIADAVAILNKYSGAVEPDRLTVANHMVGVGISPEPLLVGLNGSNDRPQFLHDERAKILSLMGDYPSAIAEARSPYTFTYIAEVQLQRGEDPSLTVEAAQSFIADDPRRNDSLDFMGLGNMFFLVGREEEGQNTLQRAEDMIDIIAERFHEVMVTLTQDSKIGEHDARMTAYHTVAEGVYFDTRYGMLAETYAKHGRFSDALRVIGKHEPNSPFTAGNIGYVAYEQFKRGLFRDAAMTAEQVGDRSFLRQLVGKEEDGIHPVMVDETTEKILEDQLTDNPFPDDYIDARITLGDHAIQQGDLEIAKAHFTAAWRMIQVEEFPEMKALNLLKLAEAVDNSGFDAINLLNEIIPVIVGGDEGWIYGGSQSRWADLATTIEVAFKRDYNAVGVAGMKLLTPDNITYTMRARILAAQGAAEIRASRV